MTTRDLGAEFETLCARLVGLQLTDDNGPILTIEDIVVLSQLPTVIKARVRYRNERTPGRPLRTSDFDYETTYFAVDGPRDAADLLLVDLEEEVLAID